MSFAVRSLVAVIGMTMIAVLVALVERIAGWDRPGTCQMAVYIVLGTMSVDLVRWMFDGASQQVAKKEKS